MGLTRSFLSLMDLPSSTLRESNTVAVAEIFCLMNFQPISLASIHEGAPCRCDANDENLLRKGEESESLRLTINLLLKRS